MTDRHIKLAASRLRKLADWLDEHGLCDEELVSVYTSGWADDLNVHVEPEVALRLLANETIVIPPDGHLRVMKDGVRLIALFHVAETVTT